MADDKLIYGIGFSYAEGVEEAKQQAKKINEELSQLFNAKLTLGINDNSVKNFDNIIKSLQGIKPIDSAASESIQALITQLTELEKTIQNVDKLNNQLTLSSNSSAGKIASNAIKIAKAEQAIAKAREASEKANLAAQKTETERSKSLIAEIKALREIAKEYEEAAKAEEKLAQAQKKDEVPQDWIDRYAAGYKDLKFTLDEVIAKYNELAQISPSSTIGTGIPELISQINSLDKTYKDFESDLLLQKSISEVSDAYTTLSLKLNAIKNDYKEASSTVVDYNNSQSELSKTASNVADSMESTTKVVNSTSSNLSGIAQAAAASFSKLGEQAKNDAELLVQYQRELAGTKNEITQLDQSYKQGSITEAEYVTRRAQLLSMQKDQTQNVNTYNQILENNVKLLNSEAGSYKALEAQLNLTKIALSQMSIESGSSVKEMQKLQAQSRALTEQLERLRVAQGKYNITQGSYGQNVRDLTYALRIYDPTLGIIIQRTQRISVLNKIWNGTIIKIMRSMKVGSKVAAQYLLSAIGLAAIAIGTIISKYKEWYDEQQRIIKIGTDFAVSVRNEANTFQIYVNALESATEGTTEWQNIRNKIVDNYGSYLKQLGLESASITELKDNYSALSALIFEDKRQAKFLEDQQKLMGQLEEEVGKYLNRIYKKLVEVYGPEKGREIGDKFWAELLKSNGKYTQEILDILEGIDPSQIVSMGNAANYAGGEFVVLTNEIAKFVKKYAKGVKELNEINSIFKKDVESQVDLIDDVQRQLRDLEFLPRRTKEELAYYNQEKARLTELLKERKEYGVFTKKEKRDTISLLKEEIGLIQDAYGKYNDLIDVVGEIDAEKIVRETYKSVIPDEDFVFSIEDLRNSYDTIIKKLRKLKVPEADILKLKVKIDDQVFKETQKELKRRLDALDKEVGRQKVANNFFDKLLSSTGDIDLATKLTFDITGRQIEDLKQTLLNNIERGFKTLGVEFEITPDISFSKIQEKIDRLPKEQRSSIQKILDEVIKYDMDSITDLYSNLSKYYDYENKKTQITLKGEEERKKIRNTQLDIEDREKLIIASYKKQSKELAKIEYETFKDSDLYSNLFDNLDNVSTTTLNNIKKKLEELKSSIGENLDPTQLKDLTKRYNDIDKELSERNPFKSLSNSVKEYKSLLISLKDVDRRAIEAENEVNIQQQVVDTLNDKISKQREYIKSLESTTPIYDKEISKIEDETIAANKTLKELEASTKEAEKRLSVLKETAKAETSVADEVRKTTSKLKQDIERVSGKISEWEGVAGEAVNAFRDIGEIFGGISEDTDAILQDIEGIVGGVGQAASGIGSLTQGLISKDPVAIASGAINAVSGVAKIATNVISLFDSSSRRANKEIKKQQKIIDQLQKDYNKLTKETSQALGTDLAKNTRDQAKVLRAEIAATQKQLAAERSKKKSDNSAIQGYIDSIEALNEQLDDLKYSLSESLLETNIAAAAKQFADSWLEAYLSFEDTKEALLSDYNDLMKRLVINTLMTKAIQHIFKDLFEDIEDMFNESGVLDMNKFKGVLSGIDDGINKIDQIFTALAEGLDLREIFKSVEDVTTNLTGLSKSIAGIQEDTALTLGAYLGTIEYYTVAKYNILIQMIDHIKNIEDYSSSYLGLNSLVDIQTSALSELVRIRLNSDIIANNIADISTMFSSVRTINGQSSSYGITVSNI